MNQAYELSVYNEFFMGSLLSQALEFIELPKLILLHKKPIKLDLEYKETFNQLFSLNNCTFQEKFKLMAMAINLLITEANQLPSLDTANYIHAMQDCYKVLYEEFPLENTQKAQLNAIIAEVYYQLKNYELLITYHEKAVKCKEKYLNTLQDKEELQQYSFFLVRAYLEIGIYHRTENSAPEVLIQYYNKAIIVADKALNLLSSSRFMSRLYYAKADILLQYASQQFKVYKYSSEGIKNIFDSIILATNSYNSSTVQYNKDVALRFMYGGVKIFLIKAKHMPEKNEKYSLFREKLNIFSKFKYPLTVEESNILVSTINNLKLDVSPIANINLLKSPIFSPKEIDKAIHTNKENIQIAQSITNN